MCTFNVHRMLWTIKNCFVNLSKDFLIFFAMKVTLSLYIPLNVTYRNICMTISVSRIILKTYMSKKIVYYLTKNKLSAHRLAVEQCRYNQTVHLRRICRFCTINRIEDECHFIRECQKYSHLRFIYTKHCYWSRI